MINAGFWGKSCNMWRTLTDVVSYMSYTDRILQLTRFLKKPSCKEREFISWHYVLHGTTGSFFLPTDWATMALPTAGGASGMVTLDKITLHPVYQITWPRLKLLWNKTAKLSCNLLSGVTGCNQTVSSAPLLRPLSVLAPGRLWPGQDQCSGPAHWQTVTRENLMMIPFRYLHCYMFVLFCEII